MELVHLAKVIDLFATATIIGATVWFFFIQSPALLSKLGREKFVPIQMRLTLVLFRTLVGLLLISAGLAAVHGPWWSMSFLAAAVGLTGGLINKYVIVPRALRAGGRSRAEIKGKDDEGSVAAFASLGAANRTKILHRTVVVFVVVMLGGAGLHMALLVSG